MEDKVTKLLDSITKDEERILQLQNSIKSKRAKMKELQETELLNNVNILTAKGFAVTEIISAIKNNDKNKLMGFLNSAKE